MEKSRLTAVAESVVDSCRSEIYFNLKFLSLAMNRLTAEVEEDLPYDVATDGSLIKLNARWLTKAYVENPKKINRALVHLMLHCIFRHFARGKNELFPDLWDVACDMHVESIVEDFNLPFLQTGKEQKRRALLSDYRNKISVFTAEGIYTYLSTHQEEAEKIDRSLLFCDDHLLWLRSGESSLSSRSARQKEQESEEDWEEIAGKTLADMQFFNLKNAGEALARDLKVDTRRRYSYRKFLKKLLAEREVIKEDPDEFDYVFYSYGFSLYGNMPLVENLEYKEERALSDFIVVIDTSGSTYSDLTELFLRETYSVIKEAGTQTINLRILQCDEAVQKDDQIKTQEDFDELMQNFTLVGGGGTDFRAAFSYIDGLLASGSCKKIKGVLYFTDGKGIYPKTVRPYPTAFVFADECYEDRNVPAWAMKLIIGKEELTTL